MVLKLNGLERGWEKERDILVGGSVPKKKRGK